MFIANAILTMSFLAVAFVHFIISAIKKRAAGEKYLFPWEVRENSTFGQVTMTDKRLLFLIILGGALEFVGA